MDSTLAIIVATTVTVTAAVAWIVIGQVSQFSVKWPAVLTKEDEAVLLRSQQKKPKALSRPVGLGASSTKPHKTFKLPPQSQLSSPGQVGLFLAGKLSLDHAKQSEWIDSFDIMKYMFKLQELSRTVPTIFFRPFIPNHFLDPDVQAGVYTEAAFDPLFDYVMVSMAPESGHFFMIFLDPPNKEVVALDSMFIREDDDVKHMLDTSFSVIQPFTKLNYKLRNYAGLICKQRGMTCGPWCMWLFTSLVMNFKGCRNANGSVNVDPLDQTKSEDVEKFWINLLHKE